MIDALIIVVKVPNDDKGIEGLIIRQKILKEGFRESIDFENVYIENCDEQGNTMNSIKIETAELKKFIDGLKLIGKRKKSKVVSVQMVELK